MFTCPLVYIQHPIAFSYYFSFYVSFYYVYLQTYIAVFIQKCDLFNDLNKLDLLNFQQIGFIEFTESINLSEKSNYQYQEISNIKMLDQESDIYQSLLEYSSRSYHSVNKLKQFSNNICQIQTTQNFKTQGQKIQYRYRFKQPSLMFKQTKVSLLNVQRHQRKQLAFKVPQSKQMISIKTIQIVENPHSSQIKRQAAKAYFRSKNQKKQDRYSRRTFSQNEQYRTLQEKDLTYKKRCLIDIKRKTNMRSESNIYEDSIKQSSRQFRKQILANDAFNQMQNHNENTIQQNASDLLQPIRNQSFNEFSSKSDTRKRYLKSLLAIKNIKQIQSKQTKARVGNASQIANKETKETVSNMSNLRMLTVLRKVTNEKQKQIKQYKFFDQKKFIIAIKPTCRMLKMLSRQEK